MTTAFPKQPGYMPTHDPTIVDHKKVSHVKLEQIRNVRNEIVPLHALPRPVDRHFLPEKREADMSLSHTHYPNHSTQGEEVTELFEPVAAKLDKQVSLSQPTQFVNRFFATMDISRRRW